MLFNSHSPISAYFADTLTIQHNRIEKAPWSGITLGWGWWNFDGSSGSVAPGRPTTTARNNTISHNHIIDTVQRLNDTAPIYTLGDQPGTTITNHYLHGVPAGHKYGLHPDEGSGHISFRDNVLSVDKNVTWLINSDDFGRKHDLSITRTYGPINKVSNKNLPNSTIEDILVSSDYVWPAAVYGIPVNSGLEDSYRDIIPQGNLSLPNYVLPASTFVGAGGTSIPIRSAGDPTRTVWLAPQGTTNFVVGPTMTRASGTATTIDVPTTSGDYRLYVVDAQGQRWTYTASRTLTNGNKCLDASGQGTANGTPTDNWDCHGGTNQQWTLNANGTITGAQSGLCLDASGNGTANGTLTHLWSCHGGTNQQWTLPS